MPRLLSPSLPFAELWTRRESGSSRLQQFNVTDGVDRGYALESLTVKQLLSVDQVLRRYDQTKSFMGNAGGPDGLKLNQFRREEIAMIVRKIVDLAKNAEFVPGQLRRVPIPKGSGGSRDLLIANVCERLVSSSANEILTRLIAPKIHPAFHGYLPRLGTHTFFAYIFAMLTRHPTADCIYFSSLDILKAFDRVQVKSVKEALLALKIPEDTIEAILTLTGANQNGVGLPQGNALCPILFTATLSHHVDWGNQRESKTAHPVPPMYADSVYADNVSYIGKSELELREKIDSHSRELDGVGLTWGTKPPPINLSTGEIGTAMGTTVSITNGKVKFRMSTETLDQAKTTYSSSYSGIYRRRAARDILISIVSQWGHIAATTEDGELRTTLEGITNLPGMQQPDLNEIIRIWRDAGNDWLYRCLPRYLEATNSSSDPCNSPGDGSPVFSRT